MWRSRSIRGRKGRPSRFRPFGRAGEVQPNDIGPAEGPLSRRCPRGEGADGTGQETAGARYQGHGTGTARKDECEPVPLACRAPDGEEVRQGSPEGGHRKGHHVIGKAPGRPRPRVTVQASRSFNILAPGGTVHGILHRHCRIVRRGDVYDSLRQKETETMHGTLVSAFLPALTDGISRESER